MTAQNAPGPGRPVECGRIALQLFVESRDLPYAEDRSVRVVLPLTEAPLDCRLLTPPLGGDLVSVRLDPADGPARFRLHALKLEAADDGRLVYTWDGALSLFDDGLQIAARRDLDGEVEVTCLGDDPQWRLPIEPGLGVEQLVVEISVSSAPSHPSPRAAAVLARTDSYAHERQALRLAGMVEATAAKRLAIIVAAAEATSSLQPRA